MHSFWSNFRFPILEGKGADNNIRILGTLALGPPLSKYDLKKILEVPYPTIHRRVDHLKKLNYLGIADERVQEKRSDQKTFLYSLTWKGLIVSIQIEEVFDNIIQVFSNCPLLMFPEKEKCLDLAISYQILNIEDTKHAIELVYEAFTDVLPLNFENLPNNVLIYYLFQSILETNYEPKYYDIINKQKVVEILKHPDIKPILQKYLDYLNFHLEKMNSTKEKIKEII